MAKRCLDLVLASTALVLLSPLMAAAALGVRLASPGPVLYRARRAGLHGAVFSMYKFRTMHVAGGSSASRITAHGDPRIFALGAWLRRLKIDELPQLFNVLRGEMSVVGPRPEDPEIVAAHYTPADRETLETPPGLASPGSIYNYTHGEALIGNEDPERDYAERLLPIKLALDRVYARRASLRYDLAIIARTLRVIVARALGARRFPDPPEMEEARRDLASLGAGPSVGPPSP
jgi:lipopolysaccharide/colanic/teichoic acid biosynthesis glycosyltransferase